MRKTLSLPNANLLYLITMVVVIFAGSWLQTWNLSIGLILTEALFILLPTLAFLRYRHIPLLEGLRLRPIRPVTALLSLLLGFSIFLFSIIIDGLMMQWTQLESVSVPASSLPSNAFESVLFFIALGILPPLCEEALFRGAIQDAYENHRSGWFAVIVVGLMFVFYHFRLTGLPALLPAAFILGLVAWRTQSILPTILIHFGLNGASAANTLYALNTGHGFPFLGWIAAGVGIVAAVLLTLAILRYQKAPVLPFIPQRPGLQPTWLQTYWPLIAAGVLYVVVIGLSLAAH